MKTDFCNEFILIIKFHNLVWMISGLEMMNFELLHYFHTPPTHIIYKHFIFLPLLQFIFLIIYIKQIMSSGVQKS